MCNIVKGSVPPLPLSQTVRRQKHDLEVIIMAIKIGTERISEQQDSYLRQVRQAPDEVKARIFYEVFTDRSILSGEETLHPDWIDIYQTYRLQLHEMLPPNVLKRMEKAYR